MPEGPLGIPRFTDIGPFVEPDKRIYVYGGSPRTVGVGWVGYDIYKERVSIRQKEDATLVDVIGKPLEDVPGGALGVILDDDYTNLFHLRIPEESRRMGLGSFYMDVFKGLAIWNDRDRVIGRIGGGEVTVQFFVANGIPYESIEVDGNAVSFETTVSALVKESGRFKTGGRR